MGAFWLFSWRLEYVTLSLYVAVRTQDWKWAPFRVQLEVERDRRIGTPSLFHGMGWMRVQRCRGIIHLWRGKKSIYGDLFSNINSRLISNLCILAQFRWLTPRSKALKLVNERSKVGPLPQPRAHRDPCSCRVPYTAQLLDTFELGMGVTNLVRMASLDG